MFAIVQDDLFVNIALATTVKIVQESDKSSLVAVYPNSGDVVLGEFKEYDKAKKQRDDMFLSFEAGCIAYQIRTS